MIYLAVIAFYFLIPGLFLWVMHRYYRNRGNKP